MYNLEIHMYADVSFTKILLYLNLTRSHPNFSSDIWNISSLSLHLIASQCSSSWASGNVLLRTSPVSSMLAITSFIFTSQSAYSRESCWIFFLHCQTLKLRIKLIRRNRHKRSFNIVNPSIYEYW